MENEIETERMETGTIEWFIGIWKISGASSDLLYPNPQVDSGILGFESICPAHRLQ